MTQEGTDTELFYEKAWNKRKLLAEQFVKLGVNDPFQLVQKLSLFEGKYSLDAEDGTGKVEYNEVVHHGEEHFFPTGKPLYRYAHLGEQLFAQPFYDSAPSFLLDYVDGRQFDAIIELGAGYGQNLVEFYYRGGPQDTPYYAAEYTESGVQMANYLASLKPEMKMSAFSFDYMNPDLSPVKERGKVLIFTSHSIEQIPEVSEKLFEYLADFAESVTCIHFEPFGFQLVAEKDREEVSKLQALVVEKKKWNTNLIPVLLEASKKGILNLNFIGKNVMGREIGNPTSVAIWESKRSRAQ